MAVRGLGCPVRFHLTGGQRGDAPQADALMEDLPAELLDWLKLLMVEDLPAEVIMADAAYNSDPLRAAVAAKDAVAVIPNNPSRTRKHPFDKKLYAERHLIECCFSKLKQFRRVATRYEKTARNYLAVVTIAATML